MTNDENWYDDLDAEELDEVYEQVAQANGNLREALDALEARGGVVREYLAEAFAYTMNTKTALDGARKIAREEENDG